MTKTHINQGRHTAGHSLGPSIASGFIATQVASFKSGRSDRRATRTFRRELNAYTSPAQIDDLLAMIAHQDDADSMAMRRVLVSNLHHRR